MAPSAAPSTTSRLSRILRLLFPSRRAVAAAVVVEVIAALSGLPVPMHAVVAVATHLVLVAAGLVRRPA